MSLKRLSDIVYNKWTNYDESKRASMLSKKRKGGQPMRKKSKKLPSDLVAGPAPEVKTSDTNGAGSSPYTLNINSGGNFFLLNGTIPGTQSYNRLGKRIRMRSLRIRGAVEQYQNGSSPGNDYIRIMVFYDRQPNGSAPAISDVLLSYDSSGNTASTAFDGLNPGNFERFHVLRDKFIYAPNFAGNSTVVSLVNQDFTQKWAIDEFIKLKDLETHYNNGANGTVGDITTGSLYVFVLGSRSSASSQYQLTFTTRMRFVDI